MKVIYRIMELESCDCGDDLIEFIGEYSDVVQAIKEMKILEAKYGDEYKSFFVVANEE
jgi:hypothetical protein